MSTDEERVAAIRQYADEGTVTRRGVKFLLNEIARLRERVEDLEERCEHLRFAAKSALDSANHWRQVSVRDRRERNEAMRAAEDGGVWLEHDFARRLLALLSGYRQQLNGWRGDHNLPRHYCPEGRNLPDAIDKLRSLILPDEQEDDDG